MHQVLMFVILFGSLFLNHPFHVSVCEINFNEGSKSLEITHKIFLDDLENALKDEYGGKIDLMNIRNPGKIDEMVKNYVSNHFIVSVDEKEVSANFIGSEVEEDAMWVYLEVPKVKRLSEIKVQNTILFQQFADQVNLVHIKNNGKLKSIKLTPRKKEDKVIFRNK